MPAGRFSRNLSASTESIVTTAYFPTDDFLVFISMIWIIPMTPIKYLLNILTVVTIICISMVNSICQTRFDASELSLKGHRVYFSKGSLRFCKWSPDGKWLALIAYKPPAVGQEISLNYELVLINSQTGKIEQFDIGVFSKYEILWNTSSDALALLSRETNSITFFDLKAKSLSKGYKVDFGHASISPGGIRWLKNDTIVYVVENGYANYVTLDISTKRIIDNPHPIPPMSHFVSWMPDGRRIVLTKGNLLNIFDHATFILFDPLTGDTSDLNIPVPDLVGFPGTVSPDGKWLALTSPGSLNLLDISGGKQTFRVRVPKDAPSRLSWSADSRSLSGCVGGIDEDFRAFNFHLARPQDWPQTSLWHWAMGETELKRVVFQATVFGQPQKPEDGVIYPNELVWNPISLKYACIFVHENANHELWIFGDSQVKSNNPEVKPEENTVANDTNNITNKIENPIGDQRILVLLHGRQQTGSNLVKLAKSTAAGDFGEVVTPTYDWRQKTVEQNAIEVFSDLNARFPNAKFVFYGFNQGGLIAKWIVDRIPAAEHRVERLITIGSPFDGIGMGEDFSNMAILYTNMVVASQALSPAIIELKPKSATLETLAGEPSNDVRGVDFLQVWDPADKVIAKSSALRKVAGTYKRVAQLILTRSKPASRNDARTVNKLTPQDPKAEATAKQFAEMRWRILQDTSLTPEKKMERLSRLLKDEIAKLRQNGGIQQPHGKADVWPHK